jgi:pimeloyl-ACP methyl ester carboxylesterase
MGGKVLMHLALSHRSYVEKMVVVDMGIKSYPMHHQEIISAIQSVSLRGVSARSQVNKQLEALIPQEGIRQFLLKNLFWKEKGVLQWRMNVDALVVNMDRVLSELPEGEVLHEALFIRGQLSNYILDDDIASIENQFLDCEVKTIDNAGHWVHSEAPEEFAEMTLGFLLR